MEYLKLRILFLTLHQLAIIKGFIQIWQNEGPLRIKLLNNLWIVLSLEYRISNFFVGTFTGPLVRENMKRVIVFVSLIFLCANIFCKEISRDDMIGKNNRFEINETFYFIEFIRFYFFSFWIIIVTFIIKTLIQIYS